MYVCLLDLPCVSVLTLAGMGDAAGAAAYNSGEGSAYAAGAADNLSSLRVFKSGGVAAHTYTPSNTQYTKAVRAHGHTLSQTANHHSLTASLLRALRGRSRLTRLRCITCTKVDGMGFHVRLLERNQVAGVHYGRPTAALHGLDGDALTISAGHSSHAVRSKCAGLHLGEALLPLDHKLSGLEVEEECRRFAFALPGAGKLPYTALHLPHLPSSKLLQTQHLLQQSLLEDLLLLRGRVLRERLRRHDDAWQKR